MSNIKKMIYLDKPFKKIRIDFYGCQIYLCGNNNPP